MPASEVVGPLPQVSRRGPGFGVRDADVEGSRTVAGRQRASRGVAGKDEERRLHSKVLPPLWSVFAAIRDGRYFLPFHHQRSAGMLAGVAVAGAAASWVLVMRRFWSRTMSITFPRTPPAT